MKSLLFALVVIAAAALLGTPAEARTFPWCVQHSRGGGRNCGFVSFDQCMATARGLGFCVRNPRYHRTR
jgi:hypothetical protein